MVLQLVAGGRLTGFSNRGYLSSIHLEQTATNTDGGYIRFETAPSGSTTGVERLRITDTGAISVGSTGTNYGTSGQVLTSGGNSNPTWTTPTTGDISGSGVAGEVAYFTGAKTIANNAGMSFSNQQIQFDGIGGGDGYVLPYDQNPGYSNMAAGGFGLLFRESYDSYITNNTYYYKTGGTSQWRAKYTTKGASVLGMLDGKFTFDTAPANTTSPYNLNLNNRMTILEGGNVGIGITSPGAQLHNYSTSTQNVWLSGYGTLAQNTWGAGHGIFAASDNGKILGVQVMEYLQPLTMVY